MKFIRLIAFLILAFILSTCALDRYDASDLTAEEQEENQLIFENEEIRWTLAQSQWRTLSILECETNLPVDAIKPVLLDTSSVLIQSPTEEKRWFVVSKLNQNILLQLPIPNADSILVSEQIADTDWKVVQSNFERTYIWLEPVKARVGVQDYYITVLDNDDKLEPNLELTHQTLMPSMGHSSEGNVNPLFEDGYYHGMIGFNMTGDWRVTIKDSNTDGEEIRFEFIL